MHFLGANDFMESILFARVKLGILLAYVLGRRYVKFLQVQSSIDFRCRRTYWSSHQLDDAVYNMLSRIFTADIFTTQVS